MWALWLLLGAMACMLLPAAGGVECAICPVDQLV